MNNTVYTLDLRPNPTVPIGDTSFVRNLVAFAKMQAEGSPAAPHAIEVIGMDGDYYGKRLQMLASPGSGALVADLSQDDLDLYGLNGILLTDAPGDPPVLQLYWCEIDRVLIHWTF